MKVWGRIAALCLCLAWGTAWAFTPFVVKDIQFHGLEHIDPDTVISHLNIRPGDRVDERMAAQAVRQLFKSGLFDDVELRERDGVLHVYLKERPVIAKVEIEGNEEIPTEQLQDALKGVGLATGRVFNRSLLARIQRELEQQYYTLGKYSVEVKPEVTPTPEGGVVVKIRIREGEEVLIRDINIVGNRAFDDATLLRRFQLKPYRGEGPRGASKYSRPKLAGDLERLRAYYLDRGFINFAIDATPITISPDKRDVFITIDVTEGERYRLGKVILAGDLVVPQAELYRLIDLREGEFFSRKKITAATQAISDRLGEEGYAFANVAVDPQVDEATRTVDLTLVVDPGRRVYARRITFTGNARTQDEVLRRELRQLESGWISTARINRSRERLERTGFFDSVQVSTQPVPDRPDQMDIQFKVSERAAGSINASIGYGGQGQGMILAASVNHTNLFGTGKRISAEINNSSLNRIYSLSYTNPYHTLDGVSRGFRLFSRKTIAGVAYIADYTTDTYGAFVNYGFPLTEYNTARWEFGYDNTRVNTSSSTPQAYKDYLTRYGEEFGAIKTTGSWIFDTRNRTIFPDRGSLVRLSTEVALPGANLTFYKANYRHSLYIPLRPDWTLHFQGDFAYGAGYGKTKELPFFEHYYGGGVLSVRGFRVNSLGPKDPVTGRALGGNRRLTGTAELIFPTPFSEESRSFRMSLFSDFGNVYGVGEKLDLGELRVSYGLSAIWLTPVGAFRFSWAWPLVKQPGDDTRVFQFTLGAPF